MIPAYRVMAVLGLPVALSTLIVRASSPMMFRVAALAEWNLLPTARSLL
jgi:hypothetical protein